MVTVKNTRLAAAILFALIAALQCPMASGKVIYVDDDAGGAGDGTSWANAYVYVQDALADANEAAKPVEVRVAEGTYKPDHGDGYVVGDQEATFVLKSGMTLKGGFAGAGADEPDACDPALYTTVLSGDLSDNDNRLLSNFTENSHHVVYCISADANTVLEGFTVTGGYAGESRGGGMYNIDARPTVRNCVFFSNYGSSGGGMANLGSSPWVVDCRFEGNLANMGGGMFSYESAPVVESCVFYDNATNMLGGGGMHNYVDSNSTVTNCLFVDNRASFGGGMYNYYANVLITNCTFCNNRTPNGWGAGIHSEVVGHTIVNNCIVWDNDPDQIRAMGGGWGRSFQMDVMYSAVQGGYTGQGNTDLDPLFADPEAGDYHVKSQAGRWDPMAGSWVIDLVTSPCVDGGDPNTPVGLEPFPSGDLINMGYYGGTVEASKSPYVDVGKYTAGTGEPNNPYQVGTPEDLILLSESPEDYDKHFILTADIDMDPNLPGRKVFDRAVIAPDIDDTEDGFQGTPFHGKFDGNGHRITHLTIAGADFLGLFGQLSSPADISNLSLEAVDVNGVSRVGGLVGLNDSDGIYHCYSTGKVRGHRSVGGVAGINWGTIVTSYSTATVSGGSDVGGLVGANSTFMFTGELPARVEDCYSTGTVSGTESVGGLVGFNLTSVTTSYSTSTVRGDSRVGGLVGSNDGLVAASYSGGSVTGNADVGGLVGGGSSSGVTACFWDIETSGQATSAGGTGLTTVEMHTASTFLAAGWDFVDETENGTEDVWRILEEYYYPRLDWELRTYGGGAGTLDDPFQIATVGDLMLLSETPEDNDKHFILTADLDLNPSLPGRKVFDRAVIDANWITGEDTFTGSFDGNGHTISNLTIEGERNLGLFARIGSEAEVRNLGVINVSIVGTDSPVGALAGHNSGELSGCYSTGTVTGEQQVGGLVGYNSGDMFACNSEGTVNGIGNTGGLVGLNFGDITSCSSSSRVSDIYTDGFRHQYSMGGLVGENHGRVNRCYSTGTVTGHQDVAGLVGYNFSDGRISSSYSTATVIGTGNFCGGIAGRHDGWRTSMDRCYSTGNVTGRSRVGGLVGYANSSITSSYSTGAVHGNDHVGGLLGKSESCTITTCYSTGRVTGTGSAIGGLLGANYWGGEVIRSFWDMQTSGQTTSAGGTGKKTADMQRAATYEEAGWGCNAVWTIDQGKDYPRLSWENAPGEPIDALLAEFLSGEGTEANPYLIHTLADATLAASFPCESNKYFNMAFLEGEGTQENPYLIHTTDDIEILNVAPQQRNRFFRLTFVEGEGTAENPYLIHDTDEIELLKTCPYEQDARYRLEFLAGTGLPEYPYLINSIDEIELLKTCPYEQNAHYRLTFVSGAGTAEGPYLVYTYDELALIGMSPYERDKYFKLMARIDLSGMILSEPVIPNFAGTFDGSEGTIANLTIEGSGTLGLFGQLESGAEVKNLAVVDVNVVGSGYYVGALAGRNSGTITASYSTGTVSGIGSNVGGLVGRNMGHVTTSYSHVAVGGRNWVGGLVGVNDDGVISSSYSTGSVSGTGSDIGGLAGRNEGNSRITTSYSTGAVSGNSSVGGLLGENYQGEVTECYSSGAVSGGDSVGGLVGEGRNGNITMSYSTGAVSASGSDIGGLLGRIRGGITVAACFWDTETSGQPTSAGGTGKTTAEMQTVATYLDAGWDFVDETENGSDDIWWILEGQGYPGFWWDKYRTLIVSSSEHGYVAEPGEGSFTCDRGTAVSIRAAADEGYLFVHWTGTALGAGMVEDPYAAHTTVTLAADYTLNAVFGPPRTVTLSADPHGSITVPGEGSFVYGQGRVLALKAVPDPDYRFLRWAGTAVEAGRVTDPLKAETEVRINADHTLQAVFAPFSPLYVDKRAAGTNDGSSWANAYETLQDALAAALPGCEIWVAQGAYRPDRGAGQVRGDRTAAFHVRDGVTIRGGYAGLGTPDPDAWNIETFATILSGDLGQDDDAGQVKARLRMAAPLHAENSYHVIVGDAGGNDAVLEGLTITGGNADGNDLDCKGGGMYLYRSSPTLLNCTFTGNSGGYTVITGPHTRHIYGGGGGLCNEHSSPTLVDCMFYQNSTGAWGGGVRNEEQSNPKLTNCSFVENFSEDAGAGMCNLKSSPTLTDCTFSDNHAGDGAGVFNQDSSPKLVGCMFNANVADKNAAAMHNQGGNPLLISCQFSHNQGQYNGGAMFNSSSNPTMVNCVFHHNTTPAFGGAMSNEKSSPEIINCTFSGNESSHGGAIYTNSPMKILNSILWHDTPDEIASKGTAVTVEYSNVQGGWKGQNISADPLFISMAQGDCHLQAGSPCTNRGSNAALPSDATDLDGDSDTREPLPGDLDGNPRISGGVVDMGAYELSSIPGR